MGSPAVIPPVVITPSVPLPLPTFEDIPADAWQMPDEYSSGQIALTSNAPEGVTVGGTESDNSQLTYYFIDGKLIGVRSA